MAAVLWPAVISARPGKRAETWSLVLLCGVQLMLILDFSIVNVALPAIGGQFGLPDSGLQWVAGSYGLTLGGGSWRRWRGGVGRDRWCRGPFPATTRRPTGASQASAADCIAPTRS